MLVQRRTAFLNLFPGRPWIGGLQWNAEGEDNDKDEDELWLTYD